MGAVGVLQMDEAGVSSVGATESLDSATYSLVRKAGGEAWAAGLLGRQSSALCRPVLTRHLVCVCLPTKVSVSGSRLAGHHGRAGSPT